MSDDSRESEKQRRLVAQSHRGSVIPGSGNAVEPRRMDQMVSVRLDPDLVSELRSLARDRGVTVSDLLREGAALVVERSRAVPYRVHVSHHGFPSESLVGELKDFSYATLRRVVTPAEVEEGTAAAAW